MLKILITVIIIIILVFIKNYFNINNKESFRTKSLSNTSIKNKMNSEKKNKIESVENKIMFSNKDYNENLSVNNKDLKYYQNDMINQSNINETAFNIVYSIDPIDYADVETGIEKCQKNCKGVCFEMGYTGETTCYPRETQGFDFGSLYKNPTFTYGYNAYGPQNLKQ
jgi:hypothetical protein